MVVVAMALSNGSNGINGVNGINGCVHLTLGCNQ